MPEQRSSDGQRRPLSLAELARHAEVDEPALREWKALGLVTSGDAGFDLGAVARARLLAFATRRGIRPEQIALACERDPDLLDRFVDSAVPDEGPPRTIESAAEEAGIEVSFARRVRTASGMPSEQLHDADVAAMRAAGVALGAGFPEEALLQLARVMADALGRVADAETRLFHFYVHERLRSEGRSEAEVADATNAAVRTVTPLMEPAIAFFHRKAVEATLREDMLIHFAQEVASAEGVVAQMAVGVLFVDLARFTPMTEAMGDAAAAEVLDRFSEMVRDVAIHCEGRVVKQIGDEFMLVFPDADRTLRYALHLAQRAAREPRFPALRIGAHYGTALYHEADYLGASVITAARVTDAAERGQFIVTAAVRDALTDVSDVSMHPLGLRALKGLAEPVELYLVDLVTPHVLPSTDPVCGMELGPADRGVTTAWQGNTYVFCSATCQQRFLDQPHRYLT